MIAYPKGEVVYENLSTEYTDVSKLLATLKTKGFSGSAEVQTATKKGAFLMVGGKVIGTVVGIGPDASMVIGDQNVGELLAMSVEPTGVINVFQVPSPEMEFIVGMAADVEPFIRDLDSDFVDINQLMKKLASENHTGRIELFNKSNQPLGTLCLKDGQPVGIQVMSADFKTPSHFDSKSSPAVLEGLLKQGAIFTVYKNVSPSLSDTKNVPKKEITNEMPKNEILAEPQIDRFEEPAFDAVEQSNTLLRDGNINFKTDFEPVMNETKKPENEVAADNTKKISDVIERKNGTTSENGRNEFLSSLQRTFSRIEKFVDTFSEKGSFQRAFKRACVEKSEQYHFLDPFEGRFEYSGKRIRLDATVKIEEFVLAVADSLNLALSYVKKDLPKNMVLPPELGGEIEATFRNYQEMIKLSGVKLLAY